MNGGLDLAWEQWLVSDLKHSLAFGWHFIFVCCYLLCARRSRPNPFCLSLWQSNYKASLYDFDNILSSNTSLDRHSITELDTWKGDLVTGMSPKWSGWSRCQRSEQENALLCHQISLVTKLLLLKYPLIHGLALRAQNKAEMMESDLWRSKTMGPALCEEAQKLLCISG